MTDSNPGSAKPTLKTLPGDDVRQILWRYADRYDLQMVVQSARSVARGLVARLVAEGARHSHEWTPDKQRLLDAMDEAGITAVAIDPEHGGYIPGPKNLALALVAFELSWVDAGAATASLAGNLALAPIHERGTPEQVAKYMGGAVPAAPGEDRRTLRGAFALTEPIPYVGVDTNTMAGRVRVAEWKEGEEPMLHVDKRGRFITNAAFANFVCAAVASDDPRIKGSCMIILEDTDEGVWDPGSPTLKLVHQLSATNDPIYSLKVPASRIIGGYTVQDGVIVPNYSHAEVIEAVFRRTRVTVGLMTAAKLLSAVEPVIRYHRQRFRGGGQLQPGSPRYELGIQQREDALHRLVDVWATGEAAASLGFYTARLFDEFDPLEREKDRLFAERGIKGARAQLKAFAAVKDAALEFIRLEHMPADKRDTARYEELLNDTLVQFVVKDALSQVFCPATKLWNTGVGANMMREAVSLMGGYGITEDCPGFLGQKWMDAQLEATYEGPEAVQRRQLTVTMVNDLFLAQFRHWIRQMRQIAARKPGTGACTLATAMELWLWTIEHLQKAKDANGDTLYHGQRQGVAFPMADALSWLLASRQQILDVLELEEKGKDNPVLADGFEGTVGFLTDLCHVMAARASGEVGRIAAELVYGYLRHPSWDGDCDSCFRASELEAVASVVPGFDSSPLEVIQDDSSHADKAGPCVRFPGMERFRELRLKLDGCLTGARLAKDRAAAALTEVMIPEALDYPR
ncbi:MAG TPA: acyl-CoA dehydrogenase [Armatimonadetes bacterium]|nr:acyl-CoA dehydrogenase [Armatimonadota bacterium]